MGHDPLPQLRRFCEALEAMTATDLHAVAAGLEVRCATPAAEVEVWRTILAVDRELRRLRRTRDAARAAHVAVAAVQVAAGHEGIALPDEDVTRVARAAADIARAMVAGDGLAADARALLEGWRATFSPLGSAA